MDVLPPDPTEVLGAVSCSADGSEVAAIHGREVVIWSTTSGDVIRCTEGDHRLTWNEGVLVWSPAAPLLARSRADAAVTLTSADLTSTRSLTRTGDQFGVPTATRFLRLAFSADGAWLAGSAADASITIWRVDTGEQVAMMAATRPATWLAFSPDGSQLVSANLNDPPQVWEVLSGTLSATIGEVPFGSHPSWSPDGKHLMMCDRNGGLLVFDGHTFELHVRHTFEFRPLTAIWVGDGSTVVMTTENRTDVGLLAACDAVTTASTTASPPARTLTSTTPVDVVTRCGPGTHFVASSPKAAAVWDASAGDLVQGLATPGWGESPAG